MKGLIPGRKADGGKEGLKPQVRAVAASWAAAFVRLLPYLSAALIVSAPLVFATAWDSFFYYYDRAWSAFSEGRVIEGVAGLLQIVLLIIPIAGLILLLVLVGKRLGRMAWRWSEGKPAVRAGLSSIRFGLACAAVVAVGVALVTWLSSGNSATSDGRTLKEALDTAAHQVATLVVGEETAEAQSDTEGSEEPSILSSVVGSILPQREEERGPSEPSTSSSEEAASPTPTSDGAERRSSPNPPASSEEPVPTVIVAPPLDSTEEPDIAPLPTPPAAEEPPPLEEEPPSAEPPEEPPPIEPPPEEPPPEEPTPTDPTPIDPTPTEPTPTKPSPGVKIGRAHV